MKISPFKPVDFRRGEIIAVLAVAAASYVSIVAFFPSRLAFGEVLAVTLFHVAYLGVGLYWWPIAEQTRHPVATTGYFLIQLGLAVAVGYVGHFSGAYWLLMFPLVGESVALPRQWTLLVCGIALAAFVGPVGLTSGDWLVAAQAGIAYTAGIVFVAVFTIILVREERARHEVERLAARLQAYATQAEELATARERNRLAREIHDSVGHYLTVANVQIEAARALLDSDRPGALDSLEKAQAHVRNALAEARRSVAALRASPVENRPLPDSLIHLVEESRAAGGVVSLAVSGIPRPLPTQVTHALYRAAQEGLTNALKHSPSSTVLVSLQYGSEKSIRLTIEDDGPGTDGRAKGGFGLLGVRERVALLGGEMQVRTAKEQGFALDVVVPG